MKKIISILALLLPWYFSTLLLQGNFSYYNEIQLPFFAPPKLIFPIVWGIVYFGIAISLYKIHQSIGLFKMKGYLKTILFNYFFNQLYPLLFFKFQNLFLSFVCCVIINISTLVLYYETKELDKKASLFLLPYLIWSSFATILSIAIYLLNF